jgi:hypothetical protein
MFVQMRGSALRAVFGVLFALLGAVSTNGVENAPTRNGYWWLSLDHLERIMFIQGYIDGLSRADKMVRLDIQLQILKVRNESNLEFVTKEFDFYAITYGQMVDGIDVFYGDFRNKRILFDYASLYVRDQIRGGSEKELQDRIESMRKATTQADYDKQ